MKRSDIDPSGLQSPASAGVPTVSEIFLARWRAVAKPAMLWALFGSIAGAAWALPNLTWMITQHGHLFWLVHGTAPAFISSFILITLLSASVGSGTEMVRRPVWYLLVLALGSAIAAAVIWAILWRADIKHSFSLPYRLMQNWLTIMLFGGSFGWAAVLNIRRNEGQRALTQLLMRRSLLARQVAQARLFAARAQVDPEMVARVLSRVRNRYRADADGAGVLLDQLIDYLRLAMNRMGATRASLAGEVDMAQAYAMLRQVETGGRIDLQIRLAQDVQQDQPARTPLFLLIRFFLKEVPPAPSSVLILQVAITTSHLQLTMESGHTPICAATLVRLHAGLHEIFSGRDEVDILHHLHDTGVHRYVVQAAIE